MTAKAPSPSEASLESQRHALQAQLAVQRQLIAERLDSNPTSASGFPRSITMRLLASHPALSAGVLVKVASLLIGRWRSHPRR